MDRPALATFLRSRRDGLRPEDVGLTSGPRRRTQGLRRDEVANLAGMSTDYYVRLEQGRSRHPSEQLLSALARALRLDNHERDYLYRLCGLPAPEPAPLDTHVAPALMRVLDQLNETPALILSSLAETLAQNPLSIALHGDQSHFTGPARSGVYRWFTDPHERDTYRPADHDHQSRAMVANLRASYGLGGERSRAGALVRTLQKASPEFARIWALQEVAQRYDDHKTLVHPEVGEIELDCQALFTEDQGQVLLVLTPAPRSEAAQKLQLLAVLGQQRFSPGPVSS